MLMVSSSGMLESNPTSELVTHQVLIVSTAKRLPYSDHIVCLGSSGVIDEQGSFSNLNQAGGYVSSFSLPRADWAYAPENDDQILEISLDKEQETIAITEPKEADSGASLTSSKTACPGEGEDGTSRRTGDVQIYFYYIKSVGWRAILIFVFAIVGFVLCISFPSKWVSFTDSSGVADHAAIAIWVQWWASYNESDPNGKLGYWLGVYAMLGGIGIVCLFVSCW